MKKLYKWISDRFSLGFARLVVVIGVVVGGIESIRVINKLNNCQGNLELWIYFVVVPLWALAGFVLSTFLIILVVSAIRWIVKGFRQDLQKNKDD